MTYNHKTNESISGTLINEFGSHLEACQIRTQDWEALVRGTECEYSLWALIERWTERKNGERERKRRLVQIHSKFFILSKKHVTGIVHVVESLHNNEKKPHKYDRKILEQEN